MTVAFYWCDELRIINKLLFSCNCFLQRFLLKIHKLNLNIEFYNKKEMICKRMIEANLSNGFTSFPIDISLLNARKIEEVKCLEWNDYEKVPRKVKITNTGEKLVLSTKWFGERPSIFGGLLRDNYVLATVNFHWGETPDQGSNNTIEGLS